MVWSRGRRAFAFGATAALIYAIVTISEVSDLLVDTKNAEVSRRVLSIEDEEERRRQRVQLRKISQKEVAAERNRIAMNEFAKRSRAARTKTMMHQGAVFDETALIQLIGIEKYRAAEDKSKILNDGTYLIFQKTPHISFSDDYMKPDLCSKLITEPGKIKRVHYHGGNCEGFDNQFGNRLGYAYGMKMITAAANIPFYFTCDRFESPNGAAFLMNLNPRNDEIGPAPKNTEAEDLSLKDVCRPCGNNFCGWNGDSTYMAADTMISDWSRLAESYSDDPTDHDDAVIHLRLGDAMYARSGFSEDKGLFPHKTYIKLLKQAESEKGSIDSIGIVTAPFKGEFVRKLYDSGSTSTSEMIAMDLVDALQEAFPRAKVTIHNSPRETIVQANSRLVNARKVAVCGCSTFCPYPLLATKGIGYMFGPPSTKHHQNAWIFNAAKRFEHFRLFETPMLNGLVINNFKTGEKLDMDVLLEWLRHQDPNAGNIDIMEEPIFRFNHKN